MELVTTAAPAPTGHGVGSLTSPAALPERLLSGGTELLFGGEITSEGGSRVADAVLTVWGSKIHADEEGGFEILATSPDRAPAHIPVRVDAPGHYPVMTELVVQPLHLTDGTLVVLHDFVLTRIAPTQEAA